MEGYINFRGLKLLMKRGLVLLSISLVFILLLGLNFVSANFPTYLQDKVVSCWTLDETSGSSVIDYGLGQVNNGTNMGGVQGVESQFATLGKAYYFSNPYNITIPSSSSLNIT